jgi:hypothetical protein
LRDAIQKLIDERVQEKFNNFMSEYSDVLAKLKSTAKSTTGVPKTTRLPGSSTGPGIENVKGKATQDGEDTPNAGKATGPAGVKRITPATRPMTAKPRSDSKESSQSKEKSAEDKRKEAEQKKKEELDKKKADA